MNRSSACPSCGATLTAYDHRCPGCGRAVPAAAFQSDAIASATRALSATSPEEEGRGVGTSHARDGWDEVRLRLQEATGGEFEILGELGRGGMAAVYLARDLELGRNVAIKVMAPGLLMGPGMVDRFRQEAVTVANLHHPNIITIHTVRQSGNLHFFVMQVVDGSSLESILAQGEPLPIHLIQSILYQIGAGLAYAHRRGVVHRDIKPANVLLDREGNAILTDFGIAKVTTAANLTQTGATLGTPAYMSPEQCMARELSGRSDQYSLGVVAYEMLAGHPPFRGSPLAVMAAHATTPPPGIREQRPDCPPELEAAVLRLLAKSPEERFADVAEAIDALGGYVAGPQDPIRADLVRLVESGSAAALPARAPLESNPLHAGTSGGEGAPRASGRPPARGKGARSWSPGRAAGIGTVAAVVAFASLSVFVAQSGGREEERGEPAAAEPPAVEPPQRAASDTPTMGPGEAGDHAAVAYPPDATPSPPPTGRWSVQEGTDLLDDSRTVTLSLPSAQGASATLVVSCVARRLDVRLAWSRTLVDEALRVRWDGGRDRDDRSQWTLLPDSLGVSYRGDPRRFLRDLMGIRSWVAVVRTPSGREASQFDVTGLESAARTLGEGCAF